MRSRRTLLAAALVTVASGAVLGVRPAVASCVGPQLAVGEQPAEPLQTPDPVSVPLQAALVVTGIWFHTGCEDGGGVSCAGPLPPSDPQSPMTGVELIMVQGADRWLLGIADAADRDQDYRITWRPAWPDGIRPGTATLTAVHQAIEYRSLELVVTD